MADDASELAIGRKGFIAEAGAWDEAPSGPAATLHLAPGSRGSCLPLAAPRHTGERLRYTCSNAPTVYLQTVGRRHIHG